MRLGLIAQEIGRLLLNIPALIPEFLDRKKYNYQNVQLFERLVSLGIIGVQLRDPLKHPEPLQHCRTVGFKGGPQIVPHYAERR